MSMIREHNGETFAYRIGSAFLIFALARWFLLRWGIAVRQHGRGAIPLSILPRISARKGRAIAVRILAES